MIEAGYDPTQLIGVMDIFEEASGGQRVLEFQSTHPSPENRREKKEAIEKYKTMRFFLHVIRAVGLLSLSFLSSLYTPNVVYR